MTNPRLIHGSDEVKFIVIDERSYTPEEVRRALGRPKVPAHMRALLAACDALAREAGGYPDILQTPTLRKALARYWGIREVA